MNSLNTLDLKVITEDIITINGPKPGPKVAIFAGVHGNELAGVYALQQILPILKIKRGTLCVAFANPPAIVANVRMINKNLNRCFYANNLGTEPEDVRARELMTVLDECDALLDLHMFYDKYDKPFVICEENALSLASTLDVDIISTNWTDVEPGASDGYMYKNGKIGLCVECGPLELSYEYTDFAIKTIHQFLAYFDMSISSVTSSKYPKIYIKAVRAVNKTSERFILSPGLKDFQPLNPGQLLAIDGDKRYFAKKGEYIIFPHYNARVSEEAYIIGKRYLL